jgi:hypothetical protein
VGVAALAAGLGANLTLDVRGEAVALARCSRVAASLRPIKFAGGRSQWTVISTLSGAHGVGGGIFGFLLPRDGKRLAILCRELADAVRAFPRFNVTCQIVGCPRRAVGQCRAWCCGYPHADQAFTCGEHGRGTPDGFVCTPCQETYWCNSCPDFSESMVNLSPVLPCENCGRRTCCQCRHQLLRGEHDSAHQVCGRCFDDMGGCEEVDGWLRLDARPAWDCGDKVISRDNLFHVLQLALSDRGRLMSFDDIAARADNDYPPVGLDAGNVATALRKYWLERKGRCAGAVLGHQVAQFPCKEDGSWHDLEQKCWRGPST